MRFAWPSWPCYVQEHRAAVLRVIESNQLYAAKEVAAFEDEFSAYTKAKYAIGMGNATQGLQLALAALGVGIGDEVIVTPYSWISSASAVLMQNAIPVFVDIETETFGICPKAFEEAISPRTKAIILVHMFGLSSKVFEISEICRRRGILLVEDASHAHGAKLHGQHLGTMGEIGVFSLHQRKAISTGDGGILCTNNENICIKLKRLRSFGDKQLSYNYCMTEFSAALGRVGLLHLDCQNKIRQNNHRILAETVNSKKISVIEPQADSEGVFYSNLLLIHLPREKQEALLKDAEVAGLPLKRTWQPLHQHPHFDRSHMINRKAPWDFAEIPIPEPASLQLKNSETYQKSLLFELDCHPLVPPDLVKKAGEWLREKV